MKKFYEAAEMDIVLFDDKGVIVASEEVFVPSITQEDNETEIL